MLALEEVVFIWGKTLIAKHVNKAVYLHVMSVSAYVTTLTT